MKNLWCLLDTGFIADEDSQMRSKLQEGIFTKSLRTSIAYQALTRISAIYKLEESWKDRIREYRKEQRQRIKAQVKECRVPEKTETGEDCHTVFARSRI